MAEFSHALRRLGWVSCAMSLGFASFAAKAEVTGDLIYVHCSESGGDFRISELNHSVSYFSERYQEYRPVCRDCEITEWGNIIAMKDGARTVVLIDRMAGRILIRGSEAKPIAGSYSVRSFQGTCVRGKPVTPKKVETARAF